jgi:hypothetical protein
VGCSGRPGRGGWAPILVGPRRLARRGSVLPLVSVSLARAARAFACAESAGAWDVLRQEEETTTSSGPSPARASSPKPSPARPASPKPSPARAASPKPAAGKSHLEQLLAEAQEITQRASTYVMPEQGYVDGERPAAQRAAPPSPRSENKHESNRRPSRSGTVSAHSAAWTTVESSSILPTGRATRAAAASLAKSSTGVQRILLTYPRPVQFAIREMIADALELQNRLDIVTMRFQQTQAANPSAATPLVMKELHDDIQTRRQRITELVGREHAKEFLRLLDDPHLRQELGLLQVTEDAQETEEDARLWRRRLHFRRAARLNRGYTTVDHDTLTNTGARQLWNELNVAAKDDTAGMSYYQLQQYRYGRSRRGSTSIAGAWEQVFAEPDGAPAAGADAADTSKQELEHERMEEAVRLAQQGDPSLFLELAEELKRKQASAAK